ncbi:MAG: hypothetical protein JWM80_6060 [Cyanobacteria bacterium RYN_339]|nr:hypothetical protein [Cyanobacteria bacterium RYN_339]
MRLSPNAIGLALICLMATAMLVWSPISFTTAAKADELTPQELALSLVDERETLRAIAHEDPRAAIDVARRRKI